MPINTKDPAAEKVVREVAAAAGESVTTAVRRAAEERLQRVRRQESGLSLAAEILDIGGRCAALPDLDPCTADEMAWKRLPGDDETNVGVLRHLLGGGAPPGWRKCSAEQ